MTTRDAAELARLALDLSRRFWETAAELQALRIALAEKGVAITPEELAAARGAVDDVISFEKAAMPPGQAAKVTELAGQLRRMLEGLAAAAPGGLARGRWPK